MRGTLVGRDSLLDTASNAVHTVGRVLIEGPAGIGKTAVLQTLVDIAQERGVTILRCAPTETEAALPLAALADLLAPLVEDIGSLPAPQQHAVRSALLLHDNPEPMDERALASATRALLDVAGERNPVGVLVAIDDVPWLDPPSERALRFALRRTSSRVHVVATRRVGETGAHHDDPRFATRPDVPLELDARFPVERIGVTPLGVGPLHRLLAQRFGVSLSRPTVARLARESNGNPLLAIELTRAALRLPRLPGPGGDLPVPAEMHELVGASLATLPARSVLAVRLAALLSAPGLDALEAAGAEADALDAVEEIGLVAVSGARIRFLHPVYAGAVRASIPTGVRHRLHVLLAESSTDPDERARQLARCTTEPDDHVAAELAAAAARAQGLGAPDLAADFYERAAALSVDLAQATALRIHAARSLFAGGSYRLAAEQADALAAELRGDDLAEALLLRAAIAFGADDLPLAVTAAQRALDAASPSSLLTGRIHAHLAVFVDLPGPARAHAEAALALLDDTTPAAEDTNGAEGLGQTDHALLASALMSLFFNEVRAGLPPRFDVLDRALALENGTPSWLAGTIPAIWWKAVDQHVRARERLSSMLTAASAAGNEPAQHELMEHLAEAETLAGNYARAAELIDGARELAAQLGAGVAAERWLAGTLDAFRGRLVDARAAVEAGMAEAAASDDPWLRRINVQLSAFVALAEGRAEDAAAGYAELDAALTATGLVEPLASRYEPDWVEACVGIGDLDGAAVALDRLARRHERFPRPWTTLALARSRVLIASASGQDTVELVAALLHAREATPADVLPFDRARCLLVAGLAQRRARRKRVARDALLAAADEFDALGAAGFAARARAEADRTGARTTAPDQLSTSELRVARLAASGATNREIADTLFISVKTVEANLARVYRKLAINRRVELATALDARSQGQA